MTLRRFILIPALMFVLAPPFVARAQAPTHAEPTAAAGSTATSEVPEVPGVSSLIKGVNAGVTFSGVHDSATGWSTIFTPALSYTINDIFSIDITVPIYMYRLAESRSAKPKPNALLVNQRGEPGDTVFGFHAQVAPPHVDYLATVAVAVPTGDELYGLTSGRVTFDFSNHFEHDFDHVSPAIELGVGDSTTLVDRAVTKNYTSLGPLAHFTAGLSFPFAHRMSFETNAYEDLPIGDQKIYTSTTRRRVTTTVVTGHNVSEDNGFTNTLDVPLDRHATLSSYYNRSLRLHNDTVGVALSYVLRAAPLPAPEPVSTDDLFR